METNILKKTAELQETKEIAKKLIDNIIESIKIVDPIHSSIKDCELAKQKMDNTKMTISVVGAFSRGKSCFLNSLLGEKLLREDDAQSTAALTFLEYGERPKMVIKFKDKFKLEDKVFENINFVDYADYLRDYASEQSESDEIKNISEKDENRLLYENKVKVANVIEKITCYIPNKILKEGITIVDTPGISGLIPGHTEMTEEQIKKSNAAICVLSCEQVGGDKDEIAFFKFVKEEMGKNTESLMYVANKMYKAEEAVKDHQKEKESNQIKFNALNSRSDLNEDEEKNRCSLKNKLDNWKDKTFRQQKQEYIDKFKGTIHEHIGLDKDKVNIFAYDAKWALSENDGEKNKSGYSDVIEHIDQVLTSDKQLIRTKYIEPVKDTYKYLEKAKNLMEKRIEDLKSNKTISEIEKNLSDLAVKHNLLNDTLTIKNDAMRSNLAETKRFIDSDYNEKIIAEINSFMSIINSEIDSIKSEEEFEEINHQFIAFSENINNNFHEILDNRMKKELKTKLKQYSRDISDSVEDIDSFDDSILQDLKNQIKYDDISFSNLIDTTKLKSHIATIEKIKIEQENLDDEVFYLKQKKNESNPNKEEIERNIEQKNKSIEKKQNEIFSMGVEPNPAEREHIDYEWHGGLLGWVYTIVAGKKQVLSKKPDYDNVNKFRKHKDELKVDLEEAKAELKKLEQKRSLTNQDYNKINEDIEVKKRILEKKESELKKKEQEFIKTFESTKNKIKNTIKIRLETTQKQLNLVKNNVIEKLIDVISENLTSKVFTSIMEQIDNIKRETERLKEDKNKNHEQIENEKNNLNNALEKLDETELQIKKLEKKLNSMV